MGGAGVQSSAGVTTMPAPDSPEFETSAAKAEEDAMADDVVAEVEAAMDRLDACGCHGPGAPVMERCAACMIDAFGVACASRALVARVNGLSQIRAQDQAELQHWREAAEDSALRHRLGLPTSITDDAEAQAWCLARIAHLLRQTGTAMNAMTVYRDKAATHIRDLACSLDVRETEVAVLKTERDTLQVKMAEADATIDTLQSHLTTITAQYEVESADADSLGDRCEVLEAERDALAKQLESAREVYTQMLDELNGLRKHVRELEAQ